MKSNKQQHGRKTNRKCLWFVSFEAPRRLRLDSPQQSVRQTKTFPTEAKAKQYAKEMLSERNKIIAGTLLNPHQPVRRIISGSELYRWIKEEAK
jgi:hypothetical protein